MSRIASGFLNSVWADFNVLENILTIGNSAYPSLTYTPTPALTVDKFTVSCHDTTAFNKDTDSPPGEASSSKQGIGGLLLNVDLEFELSDADYYYIQSRTEWEFAPYQGTPYNMLAASLTGYTTSTVYTHWAAFGAVTSSLAVNVNDVVVFLIGDFKIGLTTTN